MNAKEIHKPPFSVERCEDDKGAMYYRIRDFNDAVVGVCYVHKNAELIVEALNSLYVRVVSKTEIPSRMTSFWGADRDTGAPCTFDVINPAYVEYLERELDGLRMFKRNVDEALNSGDGVYRP